ncbi:MAG: CHAT domain-containing protein, partial [Delftia sp.]|nr:CHAT domain-containing protein [Delftia sp.]
VGVFKKRAAGVERKLPLWGQDLYRAVVKNDSARQVVDAWQAGSISPDHSSQPERRFTVFVDAALVQDSDQSPAKQAEVDKAAAAGETTATGESTAASESPAAGESTKTGESTTAGEATAANKAAEAREAAALLLGLPWELLRDEAGYLFRGAAPVQVRRRLPNRRSLKRVLAEAPIRILLASPRPEDERASYLDHRSSARPLTAAVESLGDLAELTVLSPPTFPALRAELRRAQQAQKPYDVVHFDGHGVFDKRLGLGGLCFEDPRDERKLEKRRSKIIDAAELAEIMRDYRIPLVFLDACQSAQAEKDPTASVAAALLDQGVASIVAMSHSVLVETARRFVNEFYKTLVAGARVGEAMLAGRWALKDDTYRLKIFGAGELRLQDWFVPILFQEQQDLQLFRQIPARPARDLDRKALARRLGKLPPTPAHTFVGRSRELLKLERLLALKTYAVLSGQGGQGKTTLAVELAGWLVRSRRFERAVSASTLWLIATMEATPWSSRAAATEAVGSFSA